MSLTDPVVIVCEPAHNLPYYLQRGRETFYDEDDHMRRWLTWQEAMEWSLEHLGVSPLAHIPEPVKGQSEDAFDDWKKSGQRRLL